MTDIVKQVDDNVLLMGGKRVRILDPSSIGMRHNDMKVRHINRNKRYYKIDVDLMRKNMQDLLRMPEDWLLK